MAQNQLLQDKMDILFEKMGIGLNVQKSSFEDVQEDFGDVFQG